MEFSDWLELKLKEKGWSISDLARYSGITKGAISHVMNQTRRPGPVVLNGIAKALGVGVDEVYRAAGLLPPIDDDTAFTTRAKDKLSRIKNPLFQSMALKYLDMLVDEEDSQQVPEENTGLLHAKRGA